MKQDRKSVILTGMPGSGKTTTGLNLSKKTGLIFYDLDFIIEENEKRKITEIFKTDGEEYFRKKETETIKNFPYKPPYILSLGGGTITRAQNIFLLKKIGAIFYLQVSPEKIFDRIKDDKTRPLLLKDDPKKALCELYEKRHLQYENSADFIIDANKPVEEITYCIMEAYEKINC